MRLYPHTEEEISHYSWESFLRFTLYCTNIQGSALYDATLGDKELVDQIFEELKKRQSSKVVEQIAEDDERNYSARRGYSREVEAIYDLTDNIVALRAEMGHWPVTTTQRHFSKRPLFPAEAAQNLMRARARRRRDAAIMAAQRRWKQAND